MTCRTTLSVMAVMALILLPCASWVMARDSVIWMEAEMPPYFIQSGPLQEQGYGDIISDILQERLTGYDHEEMVTNVTRHFYKFKQGEKVCSVGLYRTPEREEFIHFSIPSFLTLPAVIIINKDQWQKFGNRDSVRLEEILNNKELAIGLAKDRSYGQAVDQILGQHAGSKDIVEIAGQELSLNLFKMLMLNRVNGLIGLPEEALFHAEQMGIRDRVLTLTIEENQQGYDAWMCSVGCSNNEWGRTIIAEINRILLTERPTSRYRTAYERWLDSNSIGAYRKVYDAIFLKTANQIH